METKEIGYVNDSFIAFFQSESIAAIKPDDIVVKLVKPFYDRLFVIDPSLEQYFSHLSVQYSSFAKVLKGMIRDLGDLKKVTLDLERLATSHGNISKRKEFKISSKNFDDIGQALVETLHELIQTLPDPMKASQVEILDSWKTLYQVISSTMKKELDK